MEKHNCDRCDHSAEGCIFLLPDLQQPELPFPDLGEANPYAYRLVFLCHPCWKALNSNKPSHIDGYFAHISPAPSLMQRIGLARQGVLRMLNKVIVMFSQPNKTKKHGK